jgi:hypothetical protein
MSYQQKYPMTMQLAPSANMSLDAGLPRDAQGEREWKHGICGCCDAFGFCASRGALYSVRALTSAKGCLSCWCPCMAYGSNRSRYTHLRDHNGAPHPSGGDMCNAACCGFFALASFTGIGGFILQVRARAPVPFVTFWLTARADDEPERRALALPHPGRVLHRLPRVVLLHAVRDDAGAPRARGGGEDEQRPALSAERPRVPDPLASKLFPFVVRT